MTMDHDVMNAWLAGAGISCSRIAGILETYGDAEAFFRDFQHQTTTFSDLFTPREVAALRNGAREDRLSFYRDAMERHGIRSFTLRDAEYPECLRQMTDTPAILFRQGSMDALNGRRIAMVGSRNASYKGLRAAEKLAAGLSQAGVAIISGLAGGIDTAAHQGCLGGGSPTVAIMGCGLDSVYPTENQKLKNVILEKGGLFLSEFAPGEKPLGWHFPWRNRIISGLGEALILVEARIRSGSMTSVQHALEQGKDVFVYPGDPESPYCEGNRRLLREGAIYFSTAEDVLEDMNWLDKRDNIGQNSEDATVQTKAEGLPPAHAKVVRALEPGSRSFEQLAEATSLPAAELLSYLTILQIRGIIRALPGKVYELS